MPTTAMQGGLPVGCRFMPAYVIACVKDAWDEGKLIEYRDRNTDAVARHGGRFVARGGRHEILEGEYEPVRVVVIEFPDLEAAKGWYDSDEYAPLRKLRRSASDTDIFVVEGV
jgi:uncharacterized protein (DUF1330 family)